METPLSITVESKVQQVTENLLTTSLGDEMVMMDVGSGSYISLNKIGTVIWQHLHDATPVKDLVQALMVKYDVAEADCTADCIAYLQQMAQQKLIKLA